MALVRATREELNRLLDQIAVDDGLSSLLEMCASQDVLVHIISDGFDYCIRRILSRAAENLQSLLRGVRIAASRLELQGHLWRTAFPFFQQTCAHGCATCKPAVMRLLNRTNAPALFVGDGLSDRYAVESANLVFAKNGLARYCREQSIEHMPYNNLGDVAVYVERWLVSRAFLDDEIKERASA
jgi:2-hydroxy-3-keto-5-methylthiopentenyl-1-phosphate phosphatase